MTMMRNYKIKLFFMLFVLSFRRLYVKIKAQIDLFLLISQAKTSEATN